MTGENVTSFVLKNDEDRSSALYINRYQLFESIVMNKYCHHIRYVIHLILTDFIQKCFEFHRFLPKNEQT